MSDDDYLIDSGDFAKLRRIRDLLYRERPLSGDERRDAAHLLGLVIDRAVPYTPATTG